MDKEYSDTLKYAKRQIRLYLNGKIPDTRRFKNIPINEFDNDDSLEKILVLFWKSHNLRLEGKDAPKLNKKLSVLISV
jgi:hypothetical protein